MNAGPVDGTPVGPVDGIPVGPVKGALVNGSTFTIMAVYQIGSKTKTIRANVPDKYIKLFMILIFILITAPIAYFIYSDSLNSHGFIEIYTSQLNLFKAVYVVFVIISVFFILFNIKDDEFTPQGITKNISSNKLLIPIIIIVLIFNIYIYILSKTPKVETITTHSQSTGDKSDETTQQSVICKSPSICDNRHDSFNLFNFFLIIILIISWLSLYCAFKFKTNQNLNFPKYMTQISIVLLLVIFFDIPAILISSLFDNIYTINNIIITTIKVITGITIGITIIFDIIWIFVNFSGKNYTYLNYFKETNTSGGRKKTINKSKSK